MAFCSEEVFPWLKNLPLAPEYHPTLQEFQDPIAYIFKIEKEASQYGICKIVPPLPPAPKKTVITNFNRSLAARLSDNDPNSTPTFATRQQQIGFCPRKPCPVKKPVWQSGERYTFYEFESKAKSFEKSYLKKCGKRASSQHYSALEIETLYWRATVDKPFSVGYANDMPGSAFAPLRSNRKGAAVKDAGDVGESSWNMRGVSRAKGSLLKFMKEEIPGVTSPMVYLAMLFSWFAWHVEDHDLHSLNFLHTGAGKTWYGVPRDAAVAFEEVVRVHGYGGEVNPLVTFAVLGEKTTVISPEVLISAGVPCCRLVQNAGEFVVTFPRAYHSGFSHGFNCGEASNIATPEWLRFAKDAAFRRASINYPPMVSHFQLLFDYTLAESSRGPATDNAGPRSSRLKEKKKGEGESMIKEQFVQNVIQDNDLLHKLGKGSSIVLLPESSLDVTVCANLRVGSHVRTDCPSQDIKSPRTPLPGSFISYQVSSMRAKIASLYERKGISSLDANNIFHSPASHVLNQDHGGDYNAQGDRLSDQRHFSCVKCGILTFTCTAIIQPREAAARYLMSADCNLFNDWTVDSGVPIDEYHASGSKEKDEANGRCTFSLGSAHRLQGASQKNEMASNSENEEGTCALGLLALNYGNSSDSEENQVEPDAPLSEEENALATSSPQNHIHSNNQEEPSVVRDCLIDLKAEPLGVCHQQCGSGGINDKIHQAKSSADLAIDDASSIKSCSVENQYKIHANISSRSSLAAPATEEPIPDKSFFTVKTKTEPYLLTCNEDSSRMHIFCLEHAIEVEERLRPIGGAHIYLLCHPDYPRAEAEARLLAKELQIDNVWNDIKFRDATEDDEDRIKLALDSEDAIPGIGDWAVKLGINLFYSANLSWSPLYTKQMPYNSVIYYAFGRDSSSSPANFYDSGKRSVRQKKVVAGKWCGKIWMSNQIHPLLAQRDDDEQDEERSTHPSMVPNEASHPKPRSRVETAITKRKSSGKRKLSRKTAPSKKCKVYNNEEVSDGSLTDGSHRSHEVAVRGRRGIISKKEDTFSDDQGDENHVQDQSGTGSKQSESPDKEYSDSDRSVDGASCRPRRISRSHPVEFTLTEDEVSDDSMDDNSHQQRMTIKLRGKRAKQTEEEDAMSSGDSGDTSHWRYKRTVKKKQYSPELEDDIPNSPLEGKTPRPRIQRNRQLTLHPHQRRIRETSRGLTPSNPRSGRRKVTQHVKPGSSRLTKQVTSSQLKQSTARLIREKREPKPRQLDILVKEESGGLSSRLRKRTTKVSKEGKTELKGKKQATQKSLRRTSAVKTPASRNDAKARDEEAEYQCDLDGCTMGFSSKQELVLHKKNICPVKGCGKKFFSHKYLVQHRRVHVDDRPLKCPWKGCKMAFKWAWARTEHIRVHTGARPYVCAEPDCGQTFRFVSDFSRHKRKTGHSIRGKG